MTSIEDTTKKVDLLLQDRGLTSEYQEQAVRQLLYHLFVAIEIYKFMTVAERNKCGWWYRMHFRQIFPLSGFLKERKRKRAKENSPLHPSYKKESGVLEKRAETSLSPQARDLELRRKEFWAELEKFEGKHNKEMLMKFYYYWAEENAQCGKMKWELLKEKNTWNTAYRLASWSKRSFESNDQVASIRLTKAKGGKKQEAKVNEQQVAIARERMMEQERREREFAENKAKAVSHEEWLAMKKE